MWKAFKNDVIPRVIKLKEEKNLSRINVWSAGCSSGEEPISIAICFLEVGAKGFNINIIGTDIDSATIEKAINGRYEEQQFREMEPGLKKKYFTAENNIFKPNNLITSMIQYK